ncbi:hypothetical protein GDO81_026281, partial [Engystomops pustulosus]
QNEEDEVFKSPELVGNEYQQKEEEAEDLTRVQDDDDDEEELTLWSPEVDIVELHKDKRGLGFSILDYE